MSKILPFGKPDLVHRLQHGVLVELAQAGELDLRDRRPLLHDDDEHAVLGLDADVLEKTGGEQRADRLRRLVVGHRVADFDGQIAEDRARLRALYAFYADVFDDEGFDCLRR